MVKLVNSILEVKYKYKSKSNRFYKGIIKNEQNIIKAFQYLYWFGFVVFACLILTSDLMNLIK